MMKNTSKAIITNELFLVNVIAQDKYMSVTEGEGGVRNSPNFCDAIYELSLMPRRVDEWVSDLFLVTAIARPQIFLK